MRDTDGDREPKTEAVGTYPRTEAGRSFAHSFPGHLGYHEAVKAVLAIEAEAALLARPQPATDVSASRPTRDPVDPDYAELERLARAATPGPWHVSNVIENAGGWQTYIRQSSTGKTTAWTGPSASRTDADAAYIAAASPDVVLRLLARRAPGDRLDVERLADALHGKVCGPFNTIDPQECIHGRQRDVLLATAVAREYGRALAADSRPEQPAPLDVDRLAEALERTLAALSSAAGTVILWTEPGDALGYGSDGLAARVAEEYVAVRPEEPPEQ